MWAIALLHNVYVIVGKFYLFVATTVMVNPFTVHNIQILETFIIITL